MLKERKVRKVWLDGDSPAIRHLCAQDKRLGKAISMVGAIEYSVYEDEYEFLIWQIVGQMISSQATRKIGGRLEQWCEGRITLEAIDELTNEDLRRVGLSRPKISYIRALNDAIRFGELNFEELRSLDDEAATKKLCSFRGIGGWTASMYLIFVLDRQDVLAMHDRCFRTVFKWLYDTTDVSPAAIKKRAAKWSPYSSIAVRYFYRCLDYGFTKAKFEF